MKRKWMIWIAAALSVSLAVCTGQMSWYIGAVGSSGTYAIEGDILHAKLIDTVEQKEMTMDFHITGTDELTMTYADMQFIWAYGDREETPANNN